MITDIKDFLLSDNIDGNKFKANFEILKNQSREIYKSSSELLNEPYLGDEGTHSIDKLAPRTNRPLGYSDWFIAAYPDVVLWCSNLPDEIFQDILGDDSEKEGLDKDQEIKLIYLRRIVNAYKKIGNKLECEIIKEPRPISKQKVGLSPQGQKDLYLHLLKIGQIPSENALPPEDVDDFFGIKSK